MKKFLLLSAVLFGALSPNLSACAEELNIAIVDVPKVVASSSQVQALKKEQQAKADEMVKFIEKARKDVASVTDANKKKAMEEKYDKEFLAKREKMEKDYAEKLKALDESITQKISVEAKAKGYDIVLSKGIVLFGGKDITADIIKVVK